MESTKGVRGTTSFLTTASMGKPSKWTCSTTAWRSVPWSRSSSGPSSYSDRLRSYPGARLQPLPAEIPHAHALQQIGGLVLDGAGLPPAAFEKPARGFVQPALPAWLAPASPRGPPVAATGSAGAEAAGRPAAGLGRALAAQLVRLPRVSAETDNARTWRCPAGGAPPAAWPVALAALRPPGWLVDSGPRTGPGSHRSRQGSGPRAHLRGSVRRPPGGRARTRRGPRGARPGASGRGTRREG